jgi:N-acetylmuramoyl-L-alanine amidase/3D (Asp-Asp-Asp) domain-containing protein/peptidoglycan hydrolase-like protein with peptidoglycan-binding domain
VLRRWLLPLALAALLGLPATSVLAQAPLAGRVIVVDPGHGIDPSVGGYTGARGVNGVYEDVNVLDIAQRLAALLKAQGATVVLTRGAYDPGPPPVQGLIARVKLAEQSKADVFVAIHQDDSPSPSAHGVWTYYDHADARTLAADVQDALVAHTGLADLGTPTAGFYVISRTTMPAILVEAGFLSNPTEAALISTAAFHQEAAQAIDQGLLRWFGVSVSSGTTSGSTASSAASGSGSTSSRSGSGSQAATGGSGSACPTNGAIDKAVPLTQGSSGFAVRVLQGDLDQLGWKMAVTGSFDAQTAAALAAFQKAHGLTATGVLDEATLHAIKVAVGVCSAGPTGGGSSGTGSNRRTTGGSSGSSTGASSGTGSGGGSGGATTSTAGGSGATRTFVQGTNHPTITGGLQVGGKIDGLTIMRVINLVATAYGATAADNYPYGAVDAFGVPLKPGDVAVDPRVIPLNTKMYVTGYRTPYLPQGGELAVARDTGGAIKGSRIDMYINSTNQALIDSFGIQRVTAYILGN